MECQMKAPDSDLEVPAAALFMLIEIGIGVTYSFNALSLYLDGGRTLNSIM